MDAVSPGAAAENEEKQTENMSENSIVVVSNSDADSKAKEWDDWDDEEEEDSGRRTMKAVADTVTGSGIVAPCTGTEAAIGDRCVMCINMC